jgi:hypothetical protein
MSEPAKNKALLVHLTAEELSAIVQDAVKSAMKSAPREDKLLTVEQVCEVLNVTEEWIYHNTKKRRSSERSAACCGSAVTDCNGISRAQSLP